MWNGAENYFIIGALTLIERLNNCLIDQFNKIKIVVGSKQKIFMDYQCKTSSK